MCDLFKEKSDGELKNEAYERGYQSSRSGERTMLEDIADIIIPIFLDDKGKAVHEVEMKGVFQGRLDTNQYGTINYNPQSNNSSESRPSTSPPEEKSSYSTYEDDDDWWEDEEDEESYYEEDEDEEYVSEEAEEQEITEEERCIFMIGRYSEEEIEKKYFDYVHESFFKNVIEKSEYIVNHFIASKKMTFKVAYEIIYINRNQKIIEAVLKYINNDMDNIMPFIFQKRYDALRNIPHTRQQLLFVIINHPIESARAELIGNNEFTDEELYMLLDKEKDYFALQKIREKLHHNKQQKGLLYQIITFFRSND